MELNFISREIVSIVMLVVCIVVMVVLLINWYMTGQGPIHLAMSMFRGFGDMFCDVYNQLPRWFRFVMGAGNVCQ